MYDRRFLLSNNSICNKNYLVSVYDYIILYRKIKNHFSLNIKQFIPILSWLLNYKKFYLQGDLSAGLTVGIMLIPQGMAYAMIAGLPPIYGLYASLIPQVIYAIFGTSRQLSVAPVAMDSLLVASGVGAIASAGSEQYIALAIALALMMGIIQVMAGVLRMGFLVNFLSKPVISGFTSAAALIIGLNQLKHLLGIDVAKSNQIHLLLYNVMQKLPDINWVTTAIGISAIIILKFLKKKYKKIPGALVVVILTTITVYVFHLTDYGVSIIKEIPKGLPSFSIPEIDKDTISQLFPIAFALAIIAYMEAISVAKAIEAKRKNYKVDASQELIALGMSNIVGSFFKSYPTTGGFSRSAVNDQAGANTQLSSIIASVLIAITLLFLTPLFYYLPKTTLAAIIMVAVFGLIDTRIVKQLWKNDKRELLLLLITFIVTLTVGIQQGIITGMVLSLGFTIYKISYPHYAILGQIPGTGFYRNIERFDNAKVDDEILVFRFDSLLFYANINYFKEKLYDEIAKHKNLKLVIINAASIPSIDTTAINELKEIYKDLHNKGIEMYFAGVIGPVRDVLTKTGFVDFAGKHSFFVHTADAVEQFKKQEQSALQNIALQANKS